MTIEERLEVIAQNLDILTKIHLDHDREYQERFEALTKAQEAQAKALEAQAKALVDFKAEVTRYAASLDRVIERLSSIALHHEQRLEDLEGK
jgi:uncharacterized coiled-coil protein SlyX